MLSIDLDNIFNPYERNRWEYVEEGGTLNICPILISYYSGGQEISKYKTEYVKAKSKKTNRIVSIKKTIKKTTEENLKIKHYIKIGEECPICCEPIFHKQNSFLTSCGHVFHYSCIYNYYYSICLETEAEIRCPMCRGDMGEFDGLKDKYQTDNENGLDKLECFWDTLEYKIPDFCYPSFNHFSGFNKYCKKCIAYRKCKR